MPRFDMAGIRRGTLPLALFAAATTVSASQEHHAPGSAFLSPALGTPSKPHVDVAAQPSLQPELPLVGQEGDSTGHAGARCLAALLCCASAATYWRRRHRRSGRRPLLAGSPAVSLRTASASPAATATQLRAKGPRSSSPRGATQPRRQVAREKPPSRVVALIGRDGVGKSKLCAALLDNDAGSGDRFADKSKLLEMESAENRRNFSCYKHIYSRRFLPQSSLSRLHLIDTPGHVDRLPLVEQSLRIAHGAVVVTSLDTGVDGACGRALAAAEKARKPLAVFLNGIDRVSDQQQFDDYVDMLEARLGVRPLVLYAPIYAEGHAPGSLLLDVLDGTFCSAFECTINGMGQGLAHAAGGSKASELTAWAATLKEQLVDALTDVDEDLMVEFIEKEGDVQRSSVEAALRRAVAGRKAVPLVVGSAKTGLGVDALTEVVSKLFPAMDGDGIAGALGISMLGGISESHDAPFTAWATNVHSRKDGRFLEFQVLGGTLQEREKLPLKFVGGEPLTMSTLFVQGYRGELVPVSSVGPGDLAFTPAPTSMPLLGPDGLLLADLRFPVADIASPEGQQEGQHINDRDGVEHCVFALKLEDLAPKEREQLMSALRVIEKDDDGLHVQVDPITHETRLSCMGMLHAELLRERLAEHFKLLRFPLGPPKVAYVATLRHAAVATGRHQPAARTHIRKGIAHTHQGKADASVKIEMVPTQRGCGVEIEHSPVFDQQHGMRQSIEDALQTAGPGGIPVTDVQVRLLDADVAKVEAAVAAAMSAVQEAVKESSRIALLEPIATLEVDVPGEVADSVAEDLRARAGGLLYTQPSEGDDKLLAAEVPLREILEYPRDLQKLTGGEGSCSFKVESYREVPIALQKDIMEHHLI